MTDEIKAGDVVTCLSWGVGEIQTVERVESVGHLEPIAFFVGGGFWRVPKLRKVNGDSYCQDEQAQLIAQAKAEGRREGLLEAADLLEEVGDVDPVSAELHEAARELRTLAEGKL